MSEKPTRGEVRPSDLQFARALCRSCGIAPMDLPDATSEVVRAIRRRPGARRQAVAVQVVKRHLARRLGVSERSLPGDLVRLKAVGEYEAVGERYGLRSGRQGRDEQNAFDRHSRRFAFENGVCPRCTRPGEFTERGGRCACGFSYGDAAAPGRTDRGEVDVA